MYPQAGQTNACSAMFSWIFISMPQQPQKRFVRRHSFSSAVRACRSSIVGVLLFINLFSIYGLQLSTHFEKDNSRYRLLKSLRCSPTSQWHQGTSARRHGASRARCRDVVVIGIDGRDFRGFHFRIAGMTVLFFLAFAGQRQSCQVRCLL